MTGQTNIHIHDRGRTNTSVNNTSNVTISPRSTEHLNVNVQSINPVSLSVAEANTSRINIVTPVNIGGQDYNYLTNLPTINGVTVKGDLTYLDLFLAKQNINTIEYWNSHQSYIPEYGEIVIYTNRSVIDNIAYPGIKIGDGNAYLIDLPFVGDELYNYLITTINNHIQNSNVHVTQEEKTFWNNKLNCNVQNGNLIFDRL